MISARIAVVNCHSCHRCRTPPAQREASATPAFRDWTPAEHGLGLHMKPSSQVVRQATPFASEIHFSRGSRRVNARSIMGLMSLALLPAKVFTLEVSGSDEAEAAETIALHLSHGFREPLCPDFAAYSNALGAGSGAPAPSGLSLLASYAADLEQRGACLHGQAC